MPALQSSNIVLAPEPGAGVGEFNRITALKPIHHSMLVFQNFVKFQCCDRCQACRGLVLGPLGMQLLTNIGLGQ